MSVKTTKAKILLVEGKRADRPSFAFGLDKKGYQVESAPTGSAAITRVTEARPDIVIVDAASMRTSGRRICQALQKHSPDLPVVLILEEPAQEKEIPGVEVILVLPFTLQKLVNRLRPLLPVEPKDLMQAGPFQLDTQQRVARCLGKPARLTPRLVTLLKTLMESPGTVIEREHLFRQVWDTAYTGDTRTLDVHVSWLRQALEVDPRKPQFIKTVRGVGYRLDIEDYNHSNGSGPEEEE